MKQAEKFDSQTGLPIKDETYWLVRPNATACNGEEKLAIVCGSSSEYEANANLMVSAPDMLEALETLLQMATDGRYDFHSVEPMILKAVKKAKGEL